MKQNPLATAQYWAVAQGLTIRHCCRPAQVRHAWAIPDDRSTFQRKVFFVFTYISHRRDIQRFFVMVLGMFYILSLTRNLNLAQQPFIC